MRAKCSTAEIAGFSCYNVMPHTHTRTVAPLPCLPLYIRLPEGGYEGWLLVRGQLLLYVYESKDQDFRSYVRVLEIRGNMGQCESKDQDVKE
jgi:hypothetical protein